MKTRWSVLARLTAAIALSAALVGAAEPPKPQQPPPMSAEEKAMMDAMMKAATPGKQHQWLASWAGSWDFTSRMYQAPGAPPSESKGTAERTAILGSRVLSETVKGNFMGMEFEGHGLSGYDNVLGKWWGTWTDNFGTGVMLSTGTCDDAMTTCTFEGQYPDPMSGKMKTSKMVMHYEGHDKETMEFWEKGPDGKDMKTMELAYTRKK